jgi:hypothetical protein
MMPDMRATRSSSGSATSRRRVAGAPSRRGAEDAVALGTWATAVTGLANIEREQWRNVWPRIREFRFEERPVARAAGEAAWIAGV